jgi:hypothetical protein
MALSLTCDCGARFEVEDTLAGQEVSCPECQQPLKAPALQALPVRTSALAIASAVLALAGAFTVVGTLAAVVLGIVALVSIGRQRERLAGFGLAVFGVTAGAALTALTLLALTTGEVFGVGGWLREKAMADQIDTSGPLEVVAAKGFAVTRPSEKWGQATANVLEDPLLAPLQKNRDLLLVQPARNAFLDVRALGRNKRLGIDGGMEEAVRELQNVPENPFLGGAEDDEEMPRHRRPVNEVKKDPAGPHALPPLDGGEGKELAVDVQRAGQAWRCLVRVYSRKSDGALFVVRGYSTARAFRRLEAELRRGLDSFRLLPGR